MLKTILSIAGRPGLYRLVSQGKNMLIVESLSTGKRTPAYAHDKVISLGDIAIYTIEEDKPLSQVLEAVKTKTGGQPVDVKGLGADDKVRAFFAEILPDFDQDRVYTADIKKLLNWYNQLIAAGITEFTEPEAEETAGETAE
ncbi:MAG: DUF5606 domain-containing protein [Muribaculaceae bacterium]|nr:DUF5606 domain-containing protein [Muribaculaceae bacterium]